MPETRPSSTSMPPPHKGPSTLTLLLLLALFGGGTWAVWKFMLSDEEAPPPPVDEPERVERPTALTTAEPEPPPLPETAEPSAADAGTKQKRRLGGGCIGEINQAAVKTYAREHMGPLRTCYERRLKVNNLLQGRIVLKMTIQPSGGVSGTNVVSDSLHDSEVTSCVRQSVARWRPPAPTGGCVHVEYPFNFAPQTR